MKNFFKKIIIGFLAGFVSGLFSTGGGLILVPAFIYLLKEEPKRARGTSIFCILPMVLTSSFFYLLFSQVNIVVLHNFQDNHVDINILDHILIFPYLLLEHSLYT